MKIVIPGGSGHVGTMLARAFHGEGHEVVVLSRVAATAPWRVVAWDGKTLGDWARELEEADAVINLAGRSVNCRYGAEHRREIMESRVDATRLVGEAIVKAKRPPRVWLQASTATIYEHRFDAPNDELTGILGGNEPDAPDTWRLQHRRGAKLGTRGVCGGDVALDAAGVAALGDCHERGSRRAFRDAVAVGAAGSWWREWRRPAIRLVDS